MESLKRMVTEQGLEEKRGETGDHEATLGEAEEKEKEKYVGEKHDITVPQITWMGREYVQELRCLRHTTTRRTRRVHWK